MRARILLLSLALAGLGTSLAGQAPAPTSSTSTVAADGAGPAIEVTEWTLPNPASRAKGVFLSSRDGFVWYSDAGTNMLGRFDPKSSKFDEYHLRPGSDPNGFVEHYGSGVQTTVFFVSRTGSFVGEFDLNTRNVREIRFQTTREMHDLAFDPNGDVWFTAPAPAKAAAAGGQIGRMNVFSSEIRLAEPPTTGSSPYGLAINSVGTPFFSELNQPRLASIHPMTWKITEYVMPDAKSGARGITITPDDRVWYTDVARGYLGRLDVAARAFQEWPSPGGPLSHPTAIANVGGKIYYLESGTPLRLVRFDPATERFQRWVLPSAGEVDELFAHKDGTLWFPVPGSNRVARVTLPRTND